MIKGWHRYGATPLKYKKEKPEGFFDYYFFIV
jgi:hypothetical protein